MLVTYKHKMQSEENKVENISQAEIKVEIQPMENVESKPVKENIQAETKVETETHEVKSSDENSVAKQEEKESKEESKEEKKEISLEDEIKGMVEKRIEGMKSAVEIISVVMEIVEEKALQDKLKTCLTVLKNIPISIQGEKSEAIIKLEQMIESGIVEGVIEGLIAASKGLYRIQKIVNRDAGCKCVVM